MSSRAPPSVGSYSAEVTRYAWRSRLTFSDSSSLRGFRRSLTVRTKYCRTRVSNAYTGRRRILRWRRLQLLQHVTEVLPELGKSLAWLTEGADLLLTDASSRGWPPMLPSTTTFRWLRYTSSR